MAKKDKDKGSDLQKLAPRIIRLGVKNKALIITYMDNVIDPGGEKPVQVSNEITAALHHEPHPDLKRAVDAMAPHLAMLTDQIPTKGHTNRTDQEVGLLATKYVVRSVKFHQKDGDFEGVTVGGYRVLASKRVMNFVAPMVKFQQGSEQYEYADHMEDLRDTLRSEVVAYLGGKRADPGQITMGFGKAEGGQDEEEEEEGGEGEEREEKD